MSSFPVRFFCEWNSSVRNETGSSCICKAILPMQSCPFNTDKHQAGLTPGLLGAHKNKVMPKRWRWSRTQAFILRILFVHALKCSFWRNFYFGKPTDFVHNIHLSTFVWSQLSEREDPHTNHMWVTQPTWYTTANQIFIRWRSAGRCRESHLELKGGWQTGE